MAFDKDKTLAAAQKFVDKSQYEKAIKEYLKVVEAEPNDSRVLLQLASCYEKTGKNNEEAGRTYEKVAQCYRQQGAYQKALAVLKQAQRYLSDDDEIAMSMAELYSALGLPHEAVGQLEKCLSRCEKAEDRRSYARVLQMMVKVDSENIQTRTRYAKMLREDGDIDGAIRQYKLALAQLQSKERYVDYIQVSREYLKLSPKDEDVLQELARIYIRMERFNEAVLIMSELDFTERSVEIRELFVTCYTRLRRYKEAVEELKAIARHYESLGDRPDMIESVWQRVKKFAPNDPDAAMALGEEPPLLSESALNFVSPGIEREKQEARIAAQQAAVASEMERMLSMKFSQAMEAYRRGAVHEVLMLCQQIVDSNEQHMPALRLMSQLYENMGDYVSVAQVERKLAKAVYESDPEEAVQHILKAEHCTPRAWENFNLMLVFGFEPQKYGMSPPEMNRPSMSGQRMSVAGMTGVSASGSTAQRPPVPGGMHSPAANTAQHAAVPTAGVMPARPSAPPPPMSRPSAAGMPAVPRATRRTMDIPEPVQGMSSDVMQDLQSLEANGAMGHSQRFVSPYQQGVVPNQRPSAVGIAAVPSARPSAVPPPRRSMSGMPAVSPAMPPSASAVSPAMPPSVPAVSPAMPPSVPAVSPAMPPSVPAVSPAMPPSVPAVSPAMPSAARVSSPVSSSSSAGPVVQSFNIPAQGLASVSASEDMDGGISDLGSAVCDELDDVFDFLVRTPGEPLKAVEPLESPKSAVNPVLTSSTPTQSGWKMAPSEVPQVAQPLPPAQPAVGRVPAQQSVPPRPSAIGLAAVRPGVTPRTQVPVPGAIGGRPGVPPMSRPSIPAVPGAPVGVPSASAANIPIPVQMPGAESSVCAGIPDGERAKVMEALQEVDFYASLCLMDDARKMLQALIDKYGDVDAIHDSKVRLGL